MNRTGRELDIVGRHAVEQKRYVRAECKAQAELVGGADINKFVGALDAERLAIGQRTEGATVAGYFISLSGFRDSALEQEEELGNQRVNLVDGQKLVDTLIAGRILVSRDDAIASASRLLGPRDRTRVMAMQLLAHDDVGLVWAINFGNARQPGPLVLVHADGDALDRDSAQVVVDTAAAAGTSLSGRLLFDPRPPNGDLAAVREAYFRYVEADCGEIQLEGLPIDEQAVSGRINLESLFVPMFVEPVASDAVPGIGEDSNPAAPEPHRDPRTEVRSRSRRVSGKVAGRIPFGDLLPTVRHLALLAAPGGGKSTLVKRLAVAYAFPARRHLSADRLPNEERFPIFIRCRELGSLVREPLLKIVLTVPADRASIPSHLRAAFEALILEALHSGRALLLIDGLDEIADDGDRVAFASALRVFTSMYAGVSLVLTAREAGFRAVAGTLAGSCERYRLAELDEADIRSLVQLWYEHVYRKSADVAERVVETIIGSDRLRLLAGTPLLLTTLLLVNRWMGQLPTHKASLYEKAIEVLLRTWNVQAHEPIDLREALPRLEYVAFAMMQAGTQRISQPTLVTLLTNACSELPEVLAYSRVSAEDFIDRVELRSSLLMRSGHQIEAGNLVSLFEFRHLTFQEYLAARAIADGYYPNRSKVTASKIWRRYLVNPAWKETIGLTSSLVDHKTAQLMVEALTSRASEPTPGNAAGSPIGRRAGQLLAECLLNEVHIVPEVAERAMRAVIASRDRSDETVMSLAAGRFGPMLETIALDGLVAMADWAPECGSALGCADLQSLGIDPRRPEFTDSRVNGLMSQLSSGDMDQEAKGCLAVMILAFHFATKHASADLEILHNFGDSVAKVVESVSPHARFAASWALAWLGHSGWSPLRVTALVGQLAGLLDVSQSPNIRRQASWAICALPLVDRDLLHLAPVAGLTDALQRLPLAETHSDWVFQIRHAAATVGYYVGEPWSNAELVEMTVGSPQTGWVDEVHDWEKNLLEHLGPAAAVRLAEFQARDKRPQLTLELADESDV